MEKLTASARRHITSDWSSCFPDLGVLCPLVLLRRAGPLLQGITLNRDSSNAVYRPTFHVHSLMKESPVITMVLAQELRSRKTGAPESIPVRRHAEKYVDAAKRLAAQAPMPLSGALTTSDVLEAYDAYLAQYPKMFHPELLEDVVALLVWSGRVSDALQALERAADVVAAWPADVLERLGGAESWRDGVWGRVGDRSRLSACVQAQIEAHSVQRLPTVELS